MRNLAERKQVSIGDAVVSAGAVESVASVESVPDRPGGRNTAGAFVAHLETLGVTQAFGVSGGAVAILFDAFAESSIDLLHFRHESGAAFAATEASLESGRPVVVFTTTGPGLLNVLTGMAAAHFEGAKVIVISGSTGASQRGRWATQETSSYTLPMGALDGLCDFSITLEHPSELPVIARRLAQGVQSPAGYVAHLRFPMSIQSSRSRYLDLPPGRLGLPAAAKEDIVEIARRLAGSHFAIWAGWGAVRSSAKVRTLAERTGAPVFCSPRAKGVMPENHALYLGVTGLGGHSQVGDYVRQTRPERILVLGTRLGEATSYWDRSMIPTIEFIHVDIDESVPGAAYPEASTFGVQAEIGAFLDQLLRQLPDCREVADQPLRGRDAHASVGLGEALTLLSPPERTPVRPQVLMQVLQRQVVQATDAPILAECGNSFAWCNHYLRFDVPSRYRVSTLFGSMGHACAGVVGTALARQGKAVAVVGDGSMLMYGEISSAVAYGAEAVWIVLNDAGYGMCRDGHRALGLSTDGVDIPRVDFARLARAQGADGEIVNREGDLVAALERALASVGPYVLDIQVDSEEPSPLYERFESLIRQGSSKQVVGWATA